MSTDLVEAPECGSSEGPPTLEVVEATDNHGAYIAVSR